MSEPFERYPALASWIERLANTPVGLSLGEWTVFVGALNAAILRAERLPATPVKMLVDAEWLTRKVATDPDCDVEATPADPQPKAPERDEDRERFARWMLANSYATGHGDTISDLFGEFIWQYAQRAEAFQVAKVRIEKADEAADRLAALPADPRIVVLEEALRKIIRETEEAPCGPSDPWVVQVQKIASEALSTLGVGGGEEERAVSVARAEVAASSGVKSDSAEGH